MITLSNKQILEIHLTAAISILLEHLTLCFCYKSLESNDLN